MASPSICGLLAAILGLSLYGCAEPPGNESDTTGGTATEGGSGDESAPKRRSAMDAGWTSRTDEREAPQPYRYLLKDDGTLEVLHGQNATVWSPDGELKGKFEIRGEVTHLDSGMHPHGAGLVLGGTDVTGDDQTYTYFLVRSDQHFLIKTRRGAETQDVVAWTRHDAVAPEDEDLVTHNVLAVSVAGDETHFEVNGTVVHSAPTADLPTDGRYGFRLVHDIHVRFSPLQVRQ